MKHKFLAKIAAVTLGLAMAVGVSVGAASNSRAEALNAEEITYTNRKVTLSQSLSDGLSTTGTWNSSYYKMSTGNYLELSASYLFGNGKELSSSTLVAKVKIASFGTWTTASNKRSDVTVAFYCNNTVLETVTAQTSHLSSTTLSYDYSPTLTVNAPSNVSQITKLRITFDNFNSTNSASAVRFGEVDLTYKANDSSGDPAPTLSSISLSGSMTKTTYTTVENWDASGLVVTGRYSDSSTEDLTGYATFAFYSNSAMTSAIATPSDLGVCSNQTIYVKATASEMSNEAGYPQTVTVNAITYTVTYDANGGTGDMEDENSPYASGSTVTVLSNSFVREGYDFVCFNTQANGYGTDYNPSSTFTITANTVLYAKWRYPYTDIDNKITWDLSKTSYNSMTADSALWQSTKASVSIAKSSASTATNNYCPPSYSSTRLYGNSTLTISPASGYKIESIVFTATSTDYATALSGSSWTNATASSNSTKVTVTPTLRMNAVSATIGATTGINRIVINYSSYSALSSIALSGTYPTSFMQGEPFSHEGMTVTATYENASTLDVTSSATWSGYNMSTLGEQTVTVTYSEDGETKTADYTITISASHYIIPTISSTSGQVGGQEVLSYTYGNLTEALSVVSDATSVVTIGDNVYENGSGLVEINFVGSGSANILFKEGATQRSFVSVTVTRTANSTSSKLFTASMTSTASVTDGYDIDTDNTEKKSGFYQDKGTADSSICYFVVTKDSALFDRAPAQIKLDARLCGGEARAELSHNVEACFVDSEGNNIDSTIVTVTTTVTTSSTHYVVEMPYSADAYGVKLYHMKANGHNIRYYSFELSYSIAGSVKTICGTENKTGDVTTSVSSVVLRFGAQISDENWTAFNSEHTITDYGVMFARKTYLDSNSVSSVKQAYETNESLLYVVRRGSGTAPSLSDGNRVFTAYLTIDPSDYNTVFCATPFIVAGGQYYFLDEMRYSVKTLAEECQTTHGSPLSDEALAILNA